MQKRSKERGRSRKDAPPSDLLYDVMESHDTMGLLEHIGTSVCIAPRARCFYDVAACLSARGEDGAPIVPAVFTEDETEAMIRATPVIPRLLGAIHMAHMLPKYLQDYLQTFVPESDEEKVACDILGVLIAEAARAAVDAARVVGTLVESLHFSGNNLASIDLAAYVFMTWPPLADPRANTASVEIWEAMLGGRRATSVVRSRFYRAACMTHNTAACAFIADMQCFAFTETDALVRLVHSQTTARNVAIRQCKGTLEYALTDLQGPAPWGILKMLIQGNMLDDTGELAQYMIRCAARQPVIPFAFIRGVARHGSIAALDAFAMMIAGVVLKPSPQERIWHILLGTLISLGEKTRLERLLTRHVSYECVERFIRAAAPLVFHDVFALPRVVYTRPKGATFDWKDSILDAEGAAAQDPPNYLKEALTPRLNSEEKQAWYSCILDRRQAHARPKEFVLRRRDATFQWLCMNAHQALAHAGPSKKRDKKPRRSP